jgi:hypothetical protein
MLLKIGKPGDNGKLKDGDTRTLSLPAGHTCNWAKSCLAYANKLTGKIEDGEEVEFRCYAASMEARLPSVRQARWFNYHLLRGLTEPLTLDLLLRSLPETVPKLRLHVGGDFFSRRYWRAWLRFCRLRPATLVYGYTKALPLWVTDLGKIPDNLVLTASYGGSADHLIAEYDLRYSRVVYSPEEAIELGLEVDADDSLASQHGPPFALLLHGSQPAGSAAAGAEYELRRRGEFGHGVRADEIRKQRLELEVLS